MKKKTFNIEVLSLSKKNYRAVSDILRFIELVRCSCSDLENDELFHELYEMTMRFQKRVEKKINDAF